MRHSVRLPDGDVFEQWRTQARRLLRRGVAPEDVTWRAGEEEDLLSDGGTETMAEDATVPERGSPRLARRDLELLEQALCHEEAWRFALGYRAVWRSMQETGLFEIATDRDVAGLHRLAKAVRRDAHKMTAFVRFREHGESVGDRRRFVAWFEPSHHVLGRVAPHFRDRFGDMDWVIATPRGSIAWDGRELAVETAPCVRPVAEDGLEALWGTYFRAIFNPARVKLRAMRSEMPKHYWHLMPETALIPTMVAEAEARVRAMAAREEGPAPAFHHRLRARRQASDGEET